MKTVRTRFAPSPTGFVHVGSLRTALYNYLFAKQQQGQFLLRIEDTDQERLTEGAVENLIEVLSWAGIQYDEGPDIGGPCGPYIQSERLALYREYAEKLVAAGHAYYCTCSTERLETLRERQIAAKQPPAYDRACRTVTKKPAPGEPHVIRMKVPLDGDITFQDIIRGSITIGCRTVDDQVLIKSDGFPTYHLAVVVDDHLMGITHVIRGEEWISSTPKHILLYKYFGWEAPLFAHLPLILNPDRSKLSKRQGDVAVEDYRAKGYLRDAIINFVTMLGWNPGDTRELFSMEDLIKDFSLERVGKSGAIFNIDKLRWFNEQHIRMAPNNALLKALKQILVDRSMDVFSDEYLMHIIELMKERVIFVHDFIDNCQYFYTDPTTYDETARIKNWGPETGARLHDLANLFEDVQHWTPEELEKTLRQEAERLGVKAALYIHPLRLAVTGVSVGPSLFHTLALLGKETVIRRIREAIKALA